MSTSNRPHYIFSTQSQSLAEYITQYIKKQLLEKSAILSMATAYTAIAK